jgi:benzoyl-CoA reductase/2-hydroxyglutaryl-CoA dehydratase subunit BcrC/BadD/HgdB
VKKICYTSPFIPPEWIEACGFHPVRIVPDTPENTSVIPPMEGTCGFMQNFFNTMNTDCSAVIVTTSCDQMRRGFDIAQQDSPIPLFLLNTPTVVTSSSSLTRYEEELIRLRKFCEDLGGSFSRSRLKRRSAHHSRCRRILQALIPHMSYRKYRTLLQRYMHTGELSDTSFETTAPPAAHPIAVVGGPLPQGFLGLTDILENYGCRIVCDATESGPRCFPAPIDRQLLLSKPERALAQSFCTGIKTAALRPNTGLYTWLDEAGIHSMKGIVFFRWIWCDLWHAEVHRMDRWADCPVTEIDLHNNNSTERNKTRITAFAESLCERLSL